MQNKFSKWALIIGIVIVFNLFINYAISLIYKAPDYNSYFNQSQIVKNINTQDECVSVGGQWTENNYSYDKANPAPVDEYGKKITGYCNPDFTKQKEFEHAQKIYNRNIFIALSVLGVIALVFGIFASNIILSNGFSWGGVLSLIIASMRYWSDADNWVKVLILAVALGTLIWLALKKFGTAN
ncbi:MAG: hypothetical protein V4504_00070 [Patescibacteria group bacterium]